jgi:hypothetical protein
MEDPSARKSLVDRIHRFSMMSTDLAGLQERAALPRALARDETSAILDEAAMLAMLDVVALLADAAQRADSPEKASELHAVIATAQLPADARANRERLVRELRQGLGEGLWSKVRHP